MLMQPQPQPRKYRFARVEDPFLERVRSRAQPILEAEAARARRAASLKALLFLIFGGGCYAAIFLVEPGWSMVALGLGAALGLTMLPINIGHDAAHASASKSKLVNDLLMVATFGVLGISGHLWRHRHIHNHHMFSNLEGADTDVDATILLRFTPHHEWRSFHRFQHWYAPLLYGAAVPLRVYVMDWLSLAIARQEDPKTWRTWRMTAYFAGTKLIHLSLALAPLIEIGLPFMPWLGGYLLSYMAASTLLTVILVGTHIHEEAEFPLADDDLNLDHDWGRHVVMTSCDWAPESRVASFFFGGLNAHTSHHLMPHVPHELYVKISPILKEEAEACGLPYHRMSLWEMLSGHYRHLKALSRPPAHALARNSSLG